ncbi:MAG: nitroreductase family protein [Pygmaiobacter sp.]
MERNTVLESLFTRKSVRAYEKRDVPDEMIQSIINAAREAPTAGNMMLYTILHITDTNIKQQLAVLCDHQPMIERAPLVLVFVADYHRWLVRVREAIGGETRALGLGDLLLASSDALIAAQNAVIAAESLGLGSCYVGDVTENFEQMKALLHLPCETAPVALLCIGWPTDQQKQRTKPRRFDPDMTVFENVYPDDIAHLAARIHPPEGILPFYKRKFASDFSLEMNRSADEIYKNWSK